ncbi:hypothetical protein PIB30_094347 [Stylosanthes scabra]|uniref:Uncharacterized protein n=1 Tax=Stylosanthes scabra TaxID=79078 RepID=A0ABU6TUU9_9FABA|nr:hypothetical protein [Stylosanthes scabra]
MRVGTRTTARDWQWVNQAMEDDGEVESRLPRAAVRCRGRILCRPGSMFTGVTSGCIREILEPGTGPHTC